MPFAVACRPRPLHRLALLPSVLALFAGRVGAQPKASDPAEFRAIYQQIVEISSSHSGGGTTLVAAALRERLLAAGFKADEVTLWEPFPGKGNLVARFKGSGHQRPILLLAHIHVVEARREDWKTDPFKLEESDGVFTARGAIDDKAMAASEAIDRLSNRCSIIGLLRTTCVATMAKAGHAPNALAQSAKATLHCRGLPDQDLDFVTVKLVGIAGPKVKLKQTEHETPAPSSPLNPELMRAAGIPMYGVSGLFVDPENTGVHGLNEHIGVRQLYDGREFMLRLIETLATDRPQLEGRRPGRARSPGRPQISKGRMRSKTGSNRSGVP